MGGGSSFSDQMLQAILFTAFLCAATIAFLLLFAHLLINSLMSKAGNHRQQSLQVQGSTWSSEAQGYSEFEPHVAGGRLENHSPLRLLHTGVQHTGAAYYDQGLNFPRSSLSMAIASDCWRH